MTEILSAHRKEIKIILDAALKFSCSAQPWRGEYLKGLVLKIEEALSAEKENVCRSMLQNCRKIIKEWDINTLKQEQEKQDLYTSPEDNNICMDIAEYLEQEKALFKNRHGAEESLPGQPDYPVPKGEAEEGDKNGIWEQYRRWSETEISAWDELCSDYLARIRFSENLDFSEYVSETWGPYNTKFNIIKALELLKEFDREWLESYLMLYSSIGKEQL